MLESMEDNKLSEEKNLKQNENESIGNNVRISSSESDQKEWSESTRKEESTTSDGVLFTVTTSMDTYRAITELGCGAFSTVFRAIRHSDNEHVAVKCLDYATIEQFIIDDEVKVIKHLINNSHQFIVKFYETEETDRTAFIISEMSPIGDLFEVMQILNPQRNKIWKQLNEKECRHLIKGIASGLRHLHKLGIIHGDLKLNNILLFSSIDPRVSVDTNFTKYNFTRSDRWKPKITDFGNCETNLDKPKELIWHDSPLCTLAYSAPESYEDRNYDCRIADIFSLGCCLISMLLGAQPFEVEVDSDRSQSQVSQQKQKNLKTEEYNNLLKYDTRYKQQIFKIFSQPLRDLLTRILDSNPSNRMSLDQLFSHPWIISRESEEFEKIDESVLSLKTTRFVENGRSTASL